MERPGELMPIKAFAEAAGRSQQAIYKQIGTRLLHMSMKRTVRST